LRLAAISEGFFWPGAAGPDLLGTAAVAGCGAREGFCGVLVDSVEEEELEAEAVGA